MTTENVAYESWVDVNTVTKLVAGTNVTLTPPGGQGNVTINVTVPAPADPLISSLLLMGG